MRGGSNGSWLRICRRSRRVERSSPAPTTSMATSPSTLPDTTSCTNSSRAVLVSSWFLQAVGWLLAHGPWRHLPSGCARSSGSQLRGRTFAPLDDVPQPQPPLKHSGDRPGSTSAATLPESPCGCGAEAARAAVCCRFTLAILLDRRRLSQSPTAALPRRRWLRDGALTPVR
jgi:hypothetical protein